MSRRRILHGRLVVGLVLASAWLTACPISDPPQPQPQPGIAFFEASRASVDAVGDEVELSWSAVAVDGVCYLQSTRASGAESSEPVACVGSQRVVVDETVAYQFVALLPGEIYEQRVVTLAVSTDDILVEVLPGSFTIGASERRLVTASVSGTDDQRVSWTSTGGRIEGTGATVTYVAPDTPGEYIVTAVSVADPAVDGQAIATVQAGTTLFELAVEVAGSGTVTSTPAGVDCGSVCSAQFEGGTYVTLTASPDAGWRFASWSGDADCADGTVVMSGSRSCTATFEPDPAPTADLEVVPTRGEAPLDVVFDACGSSDDVGIDLYEFDTGDGGGSSGTSCSWSYRYQDAGTFTPTVTVHDTAGQTDTTAGADVTVTPPPATRPNFVLENAYVVPASPTEGDDVDFCVTWRNAGDATAVLPADGNIAVSRAFLDDDGATSARFSNSIWFVDIPAGDSWEDCVDAFSGTGATPGSHTIYAYTDADQEVDESNEGDNRLVFTFGVAAAPTNAAPRIDDLWAEQSGDVYACGSMIPDNDTTTFHWTASDPDGDALEYEWRMDGDAWSRQTATYENEMIADYVPHTFDVRAIDSSGATSAIWSCTVDASDPPEIFGYDGPGINETATVGMPTTFVMDVRDPDDHYPSEAVLYLYDPYQRIEMTRYLDGGADTRVTYVASVTFAASGPRRYAMLALDALGVAGDSTAFIDFTVNP